MAVAMILPLLTFGGPVAVASTFDPGTQSLRLSGDGIDPRVGRGSINLGTGQVHLKPGSG